MLFNINIDQRSYHDLGIKISIEAAAVLYMLRGKMGDVSFQEETLKENGKLYFWFKHSLVYKELEILFTGNESDEAISKKVRRIMSELETNGLIERHPHPVQLKKSMYCFTALTQTVFSSYKSDESLGQKRPSKVNHSDKNVRVTRTKMSESKAIHSDKNGIEEVNNNLEENKEEENAHAQKTFELQDEKEKTAEPQAAQPYLNANAQKTYKSHLEIYNTLVLFWKANPEYTETINLMIEPLGMGSQFPNKRKAFFDHVENIFCTSIKKNHKTPLSAFELHDMIVQKIAYAKAELSELKPIGGKEEAKEKKVAEIKNKPFISEEEESIIVAYCQDRTGYSYTTSREFRECQDIKAQRMYLQAKSNIENTKKYLINKNLIAA